MFSEEKGKFDEVVEEKGVKILVDPKAVMHVIGTEMDFVDDKLRFVPFHVPILTLSLFMVNMFALYWHRSEFVFVNPNATKCGCGESFTTT